MSCYEEKYTEMVQSLQHKEGYYCRHGECECFVLLVGSVRVGLSVGRPSPHCAITRWDAQTRRWVEGGRGGHNSIPITAVSQAAGHTRILALGK